MGEPITRLNPQIESSIQKIFLERAIQMLHSIAVLLPREEPMKRGVKPYDYRIILVLCILRILLRKTYADYEIEMRTDLRICSLLGLKILPGKSTIQRGMSLITMDLLRECNRILIHDVIQRKLNILVDASGIRIIGKSIWYTIRTKQKVYRRDCDKVHIAVCSDLLLILNWRITRWRKNDSPFFKILLAPFRLLGIIIADLGYSSRENHQFIFDRDGAGFIPFKSNATAKSKGNPAWKFAFHLWSVCKTIYQSIYHQRSKIESVFSALKKRYGDKLNAKSALMRRKEMTLRFVAYNLRIIVYYQYAVGNNLNLWVRAKRK
jgi:hypothetical protein